MGVDPGLTRCGLTDVASSRGRQIAALGVEYWLDKHHPGVQAAR